MQRVVLLPKPKEQIKDHETPRTHKSCNQQIDKLGLKIDGPFFLLGQEITHCFQTSVETNFA